VMGVARLVFRGDNEFPYGPSLCLGALATIIFWTAIWGQFRESFMMLGGLIALALPFCLLIMAPLLVLMRIGREWLEGGADESQAPAG
jgi:hypothetical protein